jgi:acyl dehydratase
MPRDFAGIAELAAAEGDELGTSDWHRVDQETVTAFGGITGDRQWIHLDPQRAAGGPFGQTIAHGYYLLSILSGLLAEIYQVRGTGLILHTGVDALRFHRPVRTGSLVRATARLDRVRLRRRGVAEVAVGAGLEVDGTAEPALTAQVLSMLRPPAGDR